MVWLHMLYLDGVYAEDNYGKTHLDEKHPYRALSRHASEKTLGIY